MPFVGLEASSETSAVVFGATSSAAEFVFPPFLFFLFFFFGFVSARH
jgi:hypothetical protein